MSTHVSLCDNLEDSTSRTHRRRSEFDKVRADAVIQSIAQAIVDDPEFTGRDWSAIGVVAILEDGARQLSAYSFDAQGKSNPALPQNDEIDDMFVQLQLATAIDEKAPWKSALFQIRREGMRYGVDFEYDDALRWKINPSGMQAVIESIRPK